MKSPFSDIHYCLVDHPTISQFEWIEGHTFGSSRLFVATTIIIYLSTILILNRFPILPPISATTVRRFAALHSAGLWLLSLMMAAGCSLAAIHQMPNWAWLICSPANHTLPRGSTFFWAYLFYLSKIYELFDTLLILLGGSRSRRRLSFLHLFHHPGAVAVAYLGTSTAQSMFPVAVVANSFIHLHVYGYYFLCAVGHRPTWKKSLTDFQILQFYFFGAISGLMLYYHFTGSGCSGIWAWFFNAIYVFIVLVLFLNFHLTNYSFNKSTIWDKIINPIILINLHDDNNNNNNNNNKDE